MVTIPKLHLKLLRDIKAARIQFGAVAFIIFLGIFIFVCTYEAYLNLDVSYNISFKTLTMGDYWISVDEIDGGAVRKINQIDGVKAQGRIIEDVFIDLNKENGEKIVGRVVSMPTLNQPPINAVRVVAGEYFSSNAYHRELLVEKHFADFYKFKPGDSITIEHDGKRARVTISGIVVSPEYIWVVKSAQEPMPSPRTFGILFMSLPMVENLFDMKGKVNEIDISLTEGTNQDNAITEIRGILNSYYIKRLTSKDDPVTIHNRKSDIIEGVRTGYLVQRKDLPSIQMLRQDLESFATLAYLFPMLFLAMACLTIFVLLSRLIESQRIQIGLMSAMGYSRPAILFHYLGFALIVGIVGSVLGVTIGHLMAYSLTDLYIQQLNIPFTAIETHWSVLLSGIIIGIAVPLIAGLIPALSTMRIQPAEAMRPATPSSGNRVVLKVISFLLKWTPYIIKLPVRNVFRNTKRSLFMAVGVASAVTLVLVAMSFVDAMQYSMGMQFNVIQHYDAIVHFQNRSAASNIAYISHLNGISEAEAILEMPYRIWHGNRKVDTSIMGLLPDSRLYRLRTPEGEPTDVANDGILIPSAFKNKLGTDIGDSVLLEPIKGTVGQTEKLISGYVYAYMGIRAYMPLIEAQKMVRDPGSATGIMLKFDGSPSPDLLERLYHLPQVASVEMTQDTKNLIDEMMGFFWVMISIMLLMGISLGVAIIFNGVTVNVLQRTREMATMRAIGMSDAALTAILSIENFIIGCFGVLIGIPVGRYVSDIFVQQISTSQEDIVSMTLVIFPRSYMIAAIAALIVVILSQIPAIRTITSQNLATVTKEWSE